MAKKSAASCCPRKKAYLSGKRILPQGITGKEKASKLIEEIFLAYNAGRLREACELVTRKMLEPKVTVGMSLAGALTPAGLGCSCIIPLINAGFVDWIVSTGANLYHDLHFALNFNLHTGKHTVDDTDLHENEVVRIYDILFGYECLLNTDSWVRKTIAKEEFQRTMSSSEFHYLLGKYAAEAEKKNGMKDVSVLAAAYRKGVPVYTSSPGDSSIGMNIAAIQLDGSQLRLDTFLDVNETAAIVLHAKQAGGRSGVMLMGGGSPKNFVLQTEPQIQEVLGIDEQGHDYFLQITDARPDTGGLSGATPHEAVSWGKVDPTQLPDAVVCYTDTTIAMPMITHYALANHAKRPVRRLYDQREAMVESMRKQYLKNKSKK